MKYIIALALLFSFSYAETISVKSWNMMRLSSNSYFTRNTVALTEYINEDGYDIVTLQEVMDTQVLSKLTDKKVLISKKLGRRNYTEHIAFIIGDKYSKADVELIEYYDTHDSFERDPVMLMIDKKIGIISVHLIYGRKSSIKYTKTPDEFTKRELRALQNMIKYFSKKTGLDEKNIIIAGDFNLDARSIQKIMNQSGSKKDVHIHKDTTLSTKQSYVGTNPYDHFVVSKKTPSKIYVDYKILNTYFGNKSQKSRIGFLSTFSDHYPIVGTFTFKDIKVNLKSSIKKKPAYIE